MVIQQSDRAETTILLVSHFCPTTSHAGGLRLLDIYSKIREEHPNSVLDLIAVSRPNIDGDTSAIKKIFNNVYIVENNDLDLGFLENSIGSLRPKYDVIDVQYHQAGKFIRPLKKYASTVLYTPMESQTRSALNYLLRCLQSRKFPKNDDLKKYLNLVFEEIRWSKDADRVICVSKTDADSLRLYFPVSKISHLETCVSTIEFQSTKLAPLASTDRPIVAFLASFESSTNIESLIWYLTYVHPKIKSEVPDYTFRIIGRGNLAFASHLVDENVEILGSVQDLESSLNEVSVGIAPALSGAGFRGKINQYSYLGIPTVASPLAINGMIYEEGKNIFIGGTDDIFAEKCVELLGNIQLRNHIAKEAQSVCLKNYSWNSKLGQINELYGLRN